MVGKGGDFECGGSLTGVRVVTSGKGMLPLAGCYPFSLSESRPRGMRMEWLSK